MLHLSASERYYWYDKPGDMRKGFDALCGLVLEMGHNVLRGGVFIFCNRRRNQLKLLCWDEDGLAIYHKRLEQGQFEWPPFDAASGSYTISSAQLQLILQGISQKSVRHLKRFDSRSMQK